MTDMAMVAAHPRQPRVVCATEPATIPSDGSTVDASRVAADALLREWSQLDCGAVGWAALRARVIESYLPVAGFLARRFAGRGESVADLTQIATVGLIKAVDRYDTSRGVAFVSFAFPTIIGELKRHFRDVVWMVRVPRSLQELKVRVVTGTDELTQRLRRVPTTAEVASWLGISGEEVLAARACASAYRPYSLYWAGPSGAGGGLVESLGGADAGMDAVEYNQTLRVLMARLSVRERYVLRLRFVEEMTQAQIAMRVGVSQMQISRILTRTLSRLRTGMLADTRPLSGSRAVGAAEHPPA